MSSLPLFSSPGSDYQVAANRYTSKHLVRKTYNGSLHSTVPVYTLFPRPVEEIKSELTTPRREKIKVALVAVTAGLLILAFAVLASPWPALLADHRSEAFVGVFTAALLSAATATSLTPRELSSFGEEVPEVLFEFATEEELVTLLQTRSREKEGLYRAAKARLVSLCEARRGREVEALFGE